LKTHTGHTFIDVLKIDVEGAEFSTLTTFLDVNKPKSSFFATTLPIGQLQLELHAWDDYANFASSMTGGLRSRRRYVRPTIASTRAALVSLVSDDA
jgi:hypothetical protein